MTDRTIKIPGPDNPITIERSKGRVIVTLSGHVIADTREALTLQEASYLPVQYIPRKDVDMAALTPTSMTTYCPYKGEAVYFSIPAGGERSVNALWTYEAPYDAVVDIKDHLAFYPDRIDAIEQITPEQHPQGRVSSMPNCPGLAAYVQFSDLHGAALDPDDGARQKWPEQLCEPLRSRSGRACEGVSATDLYAIMERARQMTGSLLTYDASCPTSPRASRLMRPWRRPRSSRTSSCSGPAARRAPGPWRPRRDAADQPRQPHAGAPLRPPRPRKPAAGPSRRAAGPCGGFQIRRVATDAEAEAFGRFLDEEGVEKRNRVIRRISLQGAVEAGTLWLADIVPEVTITADCVYWHPVGAENDDFLETPDIFPLAEDMSRVKAPSTDTGEARRLASIIECTSMVGAGSPPSGEPIH